MKQTSPADITNQTPLKVTEPMRSREVRGAFVLSLTHFRIRLQPII
jgi:hypothetical protein